MQSTQLSPFTVWYDNSEEFHTLKREIFTQGVYYLELEKPDPVIIDAGAHIGLATMYFKKMYPNAKIWSIEPLIENFTLLKKNIIENQLEDVQLIQAGLSANGEMMTLHFDSSPLHWWSTAGSQAEAWNHQQQTQSTEVPALQLSSLLREIAVPIDFLKMDIEGKELEVLKEAQSHLGQIKEMIIEYHPIKTQSLRHLLSLLENTGFSYQLWQDGHSVEETKTKGLVYVQAQQKS
ncbi:FkbM family methyltransferase [Patescibacteria group bacterium]|nr:FkbM family methyltransferase [Patescibacteria group bacterium]